MRILYVAIDQPVPGTKGGSIHVAAVAHGLAALGHDVHVLAAPGTGPFPPGPAHWHALRPPFGLRQLRMLRVWDVCALARAVEPDVIMERYYNFGGEGLWAASRRGVGSVLEVNAPVVDYPGSPKGRLDRLMLLEPMRRWREWQCRVADRIVTPTAAIIPGFVRRDRIVELEWGADTRRFHPAAEGPVPFERRPGDTIVVFSGAFRAWHGAIRLVSAIRLLRTRGRVDIKAVFIGDGPELVPARRAATGLSGVTFTGALPHDRLPACLAAADVGVAPFDVKAHPALSLGFYWSPLKVFEYMAAGLPVVTPDIPRLRAIVRHGSEGLLYDASDPSALPRALEEAAVPGTRARLGRAARERATTAYGWDTHCRALDEVLRAAARS